MLMDTIRDMIEAIGGVRATARVMAVPPSTVQLWKNRDCVPPWRMDAIHAAYAAATKKA